MLERVSLTNFIVSPRYMQEKRDSRLDKRCGRGTYKIEHTIKGQLFWVMEGAF